MFKQQYKNMYQASAFVTNSKVASGKQAVRSVQTVQAAAMPSSQKSVMQMGGALKMIVPSKAPVAQRVAKESTTSLNMLAGQSTFQAGATPRQNRFKETTLHPMLSRPVVGPNMAQSARFSTATKAQNKSASPTRFSVEGETETPVKEGFMDSVVGDLQKGSKVR